MFYLKYRPKTIDELDNNRAKEILKKILVSQPLPHALLFVGQKGTGKTSSARIFAKAINCLNNDFSAKKSGKAEIVLKNTEPCNKCKNCLSIDAFSSPDIIEMDAASNRGIEDVKNLIKETSFYPMSNQYRVYIIDEAHMITNDAFNALLKTLEEPPRSVIFILATTNQEKIPKTIHSRCLVVNFGRATKIEIEQMLKKIVRLEKIKIEEPLLGLIAEHADSSFRDATKILEELVTQNKLSLTEGRNFLGLLPDSFFDYLQKNDLKGILTWLEKFSQSGGNIKGLIEQLLEELRVALLVKGGVKIEESKIDLDIKNIILLMKLLTEAYTNLKISPIESLPLEIAMVEYYNRNK